MCKLLCTPTTTTTHNCKLFLTQFDQTLKIGSLNHLEQIPSVTVTYVHATFVYVTFVHIRNISTCTEFFLLNFKSKFLEPSATKKIFGPKIFLLLSTKNFFWPIFYFRTKMFYWTNKIFFQTKFFFGPKFYLDKFFFSTKNFWTNIFFWIKLFLDQNFFWDQHFFWH